MDVTALVEATLRSAERPLQQREIRELCGIRMTRVGEALAALIESHQAHRGELGYVLVNHGTATPPPTPANTRGAPTTELNEREMVAEVE